MYIRTCIMLYVRIMCTCACIIYITCILYVRIYVYIICTYIHVRVYSMRIHVHVHVYIYIHIIILCSSVNTVYVKQLKTPPLSLVPAVPLTGQKNSIYSLAINDGGTVLVSGGTEKVEYLKH